MHHDRLRISFEILRVALSSLLAAVLLACAPTPTTEPVGGGDAAVTRAEGAPRWRVASRLGAREAKGGTLRLVYGQLETADYEELQDTFKDERFFEEVLTGLNASLILPRDVDVRLEECGVVNAFYDPDSQSISLCYELFEHFLELFGNQLQAETEEEWTEVGSKAVAALVFIFYHELGHALIDVFDLPVTGREEDAVDQLATVMLLDTWEGEDSELAILSSAEWFDLEAAEAAEEADMADEHSLDAQRYYNLVCWIYGSDPEYFADLADDWGLPEDRAVRCADELARMSQAWDTLLGPHLRPNA